MSVLAQEDVIRRDVVMNKFRLVQGGQSRQQAGCDAVKISLRGAAAKLIQPIEQALARNVFAHQVGRTVFLDRVVDAGEPWDLEAAQAGGFLEKVRAAPIEQVLLLRPRGMNLRSALANRDIGGHVFLEHDEPVALRVVRNIGEPEAALSYELFDTVALTHGRAGGKGLAWSHGSPPGLGQSGGWISCIGRA